MTAVRGKVRQCPEVERLLQLRASGLSVLDAAKEAGLTKGQAAGILWRLGLGTRPVTIETIKYEVNLVAVDAVNDALDALDGLARSLRMLRKELRRKHP